MGLAAAQATPLGFRAISMPGLSERVSGVYCQTATACVVSTQQVGVGRIYASDGQKLGAVLVAGEFELAEKLGTLGELGFVGFSKVGDRLVAHTRNSGAAFISASTSSDITKPASWSAVRIGTTDTATGSFGLNTQTAFGAKDGRWVYIRHSYLAASADAPGPGAFWETVWSPGSPSVPANLAQLRKATPTLCDSEIRLSQVLQPVQTTYVAPDLSLVMYTANGLNQNGSDAPGVCISTDEGRTFHQAAFAGVARGMGPMGLTCVSGSRCIAVGGRDFAEGSAYVFVTNNAQDGAKSSWVRAKTPNIRPGTNIHSLSFAPGGAVGWVAGWSEGPMPLLWNTTDGGQTWQDVSGQVRAVASNARLHSVYAFDANTVWLGGDRDLLLRGTR
jgi:hypothetical protein